MDKMAQEIAFTGGEHMSTYVDVCDGMNLELFNESFHFFILLFIEEWAD